MWFSGLSVRELAVSALGVLDSSSTFRADPLYFFIELKFI